MRTQEEYRISIKEDTFNSMKSDFDQVLRNTLYNMQSKESESAEITIKLKIGLVKDEVRQISRYGYEDTRSVIKPRFDHKVTSVLQIKQERSGILCGNYELIWDSINSDYIMREIVDQTQRSFFDEDPYDFDDAVESPTHVDESTGEIVDSAADIVNSDSDSNDIPFDGYAYDESVAE